MVCKLGKLSTPWVSLVIPSFLERGLPKMFSVLILSSLSAFVNHCWFGPNHFNSLKLIYQAGEKGELSFANGHAKRNQEHNFRICIKISGFNVKHKKLVKKKKTIKET
jgi:hypothetical protein